MKTRAFVNDLAKRISSRQKPIWLKTRTLLGAFGYYRRTQPIIDEIVAQLGLAELETSLTLYNPPSLDDRIEVREKSPSSLKHETDAGTPTFTISKPHEPSIPPPLPNLHEMQVPNNALSSITNAVNATVVIRLENGMGSGFVVDNRGLVVTAAHVLREESTLMPLAEVILFPQTGQEKTLRGKVIYAHPTLDLALLWLLDTEDSLPAIPVRKPVKPVHTQTVYAIGAPYGTPNTISRGIVCNPNSRFRGVECIQTDAAIDHGNSGGPLVDENGYVLAVNSWGRGSSDALKFSLPMDYLTDKIRYFLELGKTKSLEGSVCSICGYHDQEKPTWYCRNCGAQDDAKRIEKNKENANFQEKAIQDVLKSRDVKVNYQTLASITLNLGNYHGMAGVLDMEDSTRALIASTPLVTCDDVAEKVNTYPWPEMGVSLPDTKIASFGVSDELLFVEMYSSSKEIINEEPVNLLQGLVGYLMELRGDLLEAVKKNIP